MDTFNDGVLPYGTVVLEINGVSYETNDFDWNEPLGTTIERKNHIAIPTGAVYIAGFQEGTASPEQFETFEHTPRSTAYTFVITSVGTPMSQEAEKVVAITFRRVYNP
jgi:hypothetical protein